MADNNEVIERLDILISLMVPRFDESKYGISGLAVDVLRMCDATYTVDDMAKKLQKPKNAIEKTLTKLRSLGLMKSVNKGAKTFYIRIV